MMVAGFFLLFYYYFLQYGCSLYTPHTQSKTSAYYETVPAPTPSEYPEHSNLKQQKNQDNVILNQKAKYVMQQLFNFQLERHTKQTPLYFSFFQHTMQYKCSEL